MDNNFQMQQTEDSDAKYFSKTAGSYAGLIDPVASSSAALDPSSIRNANKCQILIWKEGLGTSVLYDAYCSTNWQHHAGVSFGSFTDAIQGMLNKFADFGPNRALLKSVGENGFNQSWSGIFDAPITPFLKSIDRYKASQIETMLPLTIRSGETPMEGFTRSILTPIQNLYQLTLPDSTDDISPKARQWICEKIEEWSKWLKKGHTAKDRGVDENGKAKGDNLFFTIPADAVLGLRDYVNGLQMINNPLQMQSGVEVTMCLGPMRYPKILIESLNVKFEQSLYTDKAGNVYPALAAVTIGFTSQYRSRCDTVYFNESVSDVIKQYRGR